MLVIFVQFRTAQPDSPVLLGLENQEDRCFGMDLRFIDDRRPSSHLVVFQQFLDPFLLREERLF